MPSDQQVKSFLNGLRKLVEDETVTARENVYHTWSKPLRARVAEGRAVDELRLVHVQRHGGVRLVCKKNDSRFREGDILCLHRGDPFAASAVMATLDKDEEHTLEISSVDPGLNWGELLRTPEGWILDKGYLDLSGCFLGALNEVADTDRGRTRILPLLMKRISPGMDIRQYDDALLFGKKRGLNWSQCEAFANACATDLFYLIQGPPGSGKTRALACLAEYLVQRGERVLITALTHRAIHNALNMTARLAPDVPAIKIGPYQRVDDLAVDNYDNFAGSPLADTEGGYIIGATPFATRTSRLNSVTFDTIIFDEASQVTLPLAVMGMLAGQRYIFIGDQQQLPPIFSTRDHPETLKDSIFGALSGQGYETMLNETYRMNRALTAWPSYTFYRGELQSHAAAAERVITYPRRPRQFSEILDPHHPRIFLDLAHHTSTVRNADEAGLIGKLVHELIECGMAAREIAIVTPYRSQARAIRRVLRFTVSQHGSEIVTDTVERMQGQERDLIIASLTTSNPAFAGKLADFYFQPQRLNVSITRARMKLIIVGSRHLLEARPEEPRAVEMVERMRDLLDNSTYILGTDM